MHDANYRKDKVNDNNSYCAYSLFAGGRCSDSKCKCNPDIRISYRVFYAMSWFGKFKYSRTESCLSQMTKCRHQERSLCSLQWCSFLESQVQEHASSEVEEDPVKVTAAEEMVAEDNCRVELLVQAKIDVVRVKGEAPGQCWWSNCRFCLQKRT